MINDFFELKENLDKIINMRWIKCVTNNNGSAGHTLEKLLNIHSDNFEIPDYNTIEIKSKVSKKENYIDLFCATPDSYIFEIKRLYKKYGCLDRTNNIYNALRFTLYGEFLIKVNDEYNGKLRINYKDKKVILEIYNSKMELVDNYSSWSFDLLNEKLYRKLSYLCFVEGERKFIRNEQYVKFTKYTFYKLKDINTFIRLLKRGQIRIAFTIGTYKTGKKVGKIYDHGTQFSIKKENLVLLFDEINIEIKRSGELLGQEKTDKNMSVNNLNGREDRI